MNKHLVIALLLAGASLSVLPGCWNCCNKTEKVEEAAAPEQTAPETSMPTEESTTTEQHEEQK